MIEFLIWYTVWFITGVFVMAYIDKDCTIMADASRAHFLLPAVLILSWPFWLGKYWRN